MHRTAARALYISLSPHALLFVLLVHLPVEGANHNPAPQFNHVSCVSGARTSKDERPRMHALILSDTGIQKLANDLIDLLITFASESHACLLAQPDPAESSSLQASTSRG